MDLPNRIQHEMIAYSPSVAINTRYVHRYCERDRVNLVRVSTPIEGITGMFDLVTCGTITSQTDIDVFIDEMCRQHVAHFDAINDSYSYIEAHNDAA